LNHKLKVNWHFSENFGDQLNPYLVKRIWNIEPYKVSWTCNSPHLMMLGSIINEANSHSLVAGAGIVAPNRNFLGNPNFCFVRGNLTAEVLRKKGAEIQSDVIGDPAIILPRLYSPKASTEKYDLGVIPHVIDIDAAKSIFEKIKGVKIISLKLKSPSDPEIEEIIDSIASCKSIISSSLHGLIVAHSYGIPGAWCEFSDRVIGKGFKFRDYFSTYSSEYSTFDSINFKNFRGKVDIDGVIKNSSNFLLQNTNLSDGVLQKFEEISSVILDKGNDYLV
jgi:pyruvyltransferase